MSPKPTSLMERTIDHLRGEANGFSLRYGLSPVYLAGSAAQGDQDPRDLDVSIVVSDDLFWHLYGFPTGREKAMGEWCESWLQPPTRTWLRWAKDCAKGSERLTFGYFVDFKVWPAWYAKAHFVGMPKIRLDTIGREP